jgi:hypothetical protein
MDVDPNIKLHKEVVTGIVQMIKSAIEQLHDSGSASFEIFCNTGLKGKSVTAQTFIAEFAKDGMANITWPDMKKVEAGDYTDIWTLTNKYLTGFGHDSIEPVSIDV